MVRCNHKSSETLAFLADLLESLQQFSTLDQDRASLRRTYFMNSYGKIRPRGNCVKIRDVDNCSVNVDGTIDLVVNIGGRVEIVLFNIVERLATQLSLWCEYCDKHIESIHPRKRQVELVDGTIVQIVSKPPPTDKDSITLPEAHEYKSTHRHTSEKFQL